MTYVPNKGHQNALPSFELIPLLTNLCISLCVKGGLGKLFEDMF